MAEPETSEHRSLPTLLRSLADEQFSGIVHVHGSVERIICLAEGRLYLAMSASGPSLHRVFTTAGVIDDAGWAAALEAAPDHPSLAASLVAEGADPDALSHSVREVTIATILELLVPDDERFAVAAGEEHQLGPDFSATVDDVLAEAGARLERWGSLQERLPSMQTPLRRCETFPIGTASVEIDRIQWRILSELDRPRPLAELIEATGLGAFGIFDELYDLLSAGVVDVVTDEPAEAGS
ncbi:MAG: DUF4388 domain-containing protein [Actinomycetota bacterium]